MVLVVAHASNIAEKDALKTDTRESPTYFFTNDVRFLRIVRDAWSRRIVWNLFISCKLCISLFRDESTVESSRKCALRSHKLFANKLEPLAIKY
jgi:predicted restriction endonuclease